MAKALRWKADFTRFNQKIQKAELALNDGAEQGMEYSGKAATNEMRRLVEIRGTFGSTKRYAGEYLAASLSENMKQDSGGPGNSSGRNNTGTMINSIDSKIVKSFDGMRIEVGYLNNAQQYFKLQEYGFWNHGKWIKQRANGKGGYFINAKEPVRWTEGIFALRDSLSLFEKVSPGLIGAQISNKLKARGLS